MTVIAQDDHLTAGAWAACDTIGQSRAYLPIETCKDSRPSAIACEPFKRGFGKALDTIMPPKHDFRSKKSLNVVTFKGGKS